PTFQSRWSWVPAFAGTTSVDIAPALPRDRAPFVGKLLGAALRQREDGVGRVRRPGGREDAGPRHVEVRDLVGLAVAVDHRVRRAGPHDGAAHQMDRRHVAARRPYLLGAGRLGDLEALLEVRVPHRDRVIVVAVDDAADRHAELVLVARELDAVL